MPKTQKTKSWNRLQRTKPQNKIFMVVKKAELIARLFCGRLLINDPIKVKQNLDQRPEALYIGKDYPKWLILLALYII